MRIDYDLQNMIAGLAQLGAVYLRISSRVQAFYQENPLLKIEAANLSGGKDENISGAGAGQMVEEMLGRNTDLPPAREEVLFLKRYALKFDDPVLAMEVTREFLGKDRMQRMDYITKLKEQLRLFPDPKLGFSDLRTFGYVERDMFPLRKVAAAELFATRRIAVYALFRDGRSEIIDSDTMLYTHDGMFGVLREDWLAFSIEEFKAEREFHFFFRSNSKMFRIYQWKENDPDIDRCSFMPYEALEAMEISVDVSRYDLIYEGTIRDEAALEDIYEKFNLDHPKDFRGHSLSVGDVIGCMEEGMWVFYYVQPFGYRRLDDFTRASIPDRKTCLEPEGGTSPQIVEVEEAREPENHIRDETVRKNSRSR